MRPFFIALWLQVTKIYLWLIYFCFACILTSLTTVKEAYE